MIFAFFLTIQTNGQNIDSLQLTDKEIPENYSLTKDNNCISIQACTFYDNPGMYGMLIGKLKTKRIQNFDNKKDKGAIMYFEFEDGFKGDGFLGRLLWGGDKPTRFFFQKNLFEYTSFNNCFPFFVSGIFPVLWFLIFIKSKN